MNMYDSWLNRSHAIGPLLVHCHWLGANGCPDMSIIQDDWRIGIALVRYEPGVRGARIKLRINLVVASFSICRRRKAK